MAGMPTNQRDQLMLFAGIMGILGAAAFWNWVYVPKDAEMDTIRTHIENLDASNQRAKAIMARGSVEQLQEEAKRLQANLDLMRTLIPTGTEVPALLTQVLGAARRSGLEISGFTPGATTVGEQFDTQRIQMSVQGTYHDIGELLAQVGSLRRIIVPTNVRLTPSGSRAAAQSAPEDKLLMAMFDIQTFVAKTGPAGEEADK